MVKLRLTTIDAKAAIDEVRSAAIGKRLLNVYDLSPRVYLLKFGQGESKVYVIFEAGVRLHLTTFSREKPKVPSQFTLKLRKHVRSWRLEEINQVGTDRVVDLRFGSGDNAHHFVLELYGQGNFFLTDARYTILMLLRSTKNDDVRLAVRETYSMAQAKQHSGRTRDEIFNALDKAKDSDALRSCLPLGFYGTLLGDHMLASCGLNPSEPKRAWSDHMEAIADSVHGVLKSMDELMTRELLDGGVLVKLGSQADVRKSRERAATAAVSKDDDEDGAAAGGDGAQSSSSAVPSLVSSGIGLPSCSVDAPDEFWPASVERFLDRGRVVAVERMTSFSDAVDRCFRLSEQEKITQHNTKKEKAVMSKKEKFYRDHQRRIDSLTNEEDRNRRLGDLIVLHVEEVDAAITLVNEVLATGMSWEQLGSLLRIRQSEGTHPVANIIHELKLYKNTISLLLTEEVDDDDELEDADVVPIVVDVDIGLGAYANAAKYHSQKKAVREKLTKTIEATGKAAQAAGRSGERAAKKVVAKQDITQLRTPMWFEKFCWFLTSNGNIVVSGHDAMQADMLFKRYLSPGDIWIHTDAAGCHPAIVKNLNFGKIAQASVEEAGIMCVARSEAWRKATVSAWWCLATQVSKRSPHGDHLGPGQFSVRGAKNFMPAMQLQLAVGIVFRTDSTRPPRESGGTSLIDVSELWSEQQQQLSAASAVASSRASGVRSAASAPGEGDDTSPVPPPATDEDRTTSGELTTESPTAGSPPTFPATTAATDDSAEAGDSGAPLAAQLHLQQQQQQATADKGASKLRRLRRPVAPAAAGESASDSQSDARTISMTSTQTGASARSKGTGAPGASPPAGTPTAQDVAQGSNLPPRTATKLKKIKKKYAHQDDDDRQRAMALLGNNVSRVHQAMLQAEVARDADDADDDDAQQPQASASGRVRFADNQEEGGESSGGDEARDFCADAMEREHDAMNRRASSFDDDTAKIAERIADEMASIVPYLDGCPSMDTSTDFRDVIVVCAPYAAVRHYTFKMRIAPGTEKKGQAAKAMLEAFTKHAGVALPRAAEVLKTLTVDATVSQLVGPLKVHLGDAAAPVTASGGGEEAKVSVRQKAKMKKEETEKALMDKMRAERRARLEAKAKGADGGGCGADASSSRSAQHVDVETPPLAS